MKKDDQFMFPMKIIYESLRNEVSKPSDERTEESERIEAGEDPYISDDKLLDESERQIAKFEFSSYLLFGAIHRSVGCWHN